MKPDKLPDSFHRVPVTTALDPTSYLFPTRTVRCYHCNEKMPGDSGVQIMHRLSGSAVSMVVIVHAHCSEQIP